MDTTVLTGSITMSGERIGIALILLQQGLFTIDSGAIHDLSGAATLYQLGFLRSAAGIILALCLAASGGQTSFRTHRPLLQAVRVSVSVAYSWVLIYSFSAMPFADATAISYTSAIYVVLLAPLVVGESIKSNRVLAVTLGLFGAAMVIKPEFTHGSMIYLLVLAGTCLNALAMLLTKRLQQYDSAATVMFYVNAAGLIAFLPGVVDPLPPMWAWPWIAAMCLSGPLGMFAGIVALRHADASTLAPFTYIRLIFAIAGGTLLLGELPGFLSIAGIICIAAGCFTAEREPRSVLPVQVRQVSRPGGQPIPLG